MPCRINLRHDQCRRHVESPETDQEGIIIFAANWVQQGLEKLGEKLNGITFQVIDGNGDSNSKVVDTVTLTDKISLIDLQKITRVEPRNVTGIINKLYYEPDITDPGIIYALRDLVRQCIIIGLDETTHFGGYGPPRTCQVTQVYIIDLSGLQFQQIYNTGRLVLIAEIPNKIPSGFLDDLIFEKVVGETKKSYQEADSDKTGRYEKGPNFNLTINHVYFDTFAYRKFVSQDVVLCGIALNNLAHKNGHNFVHFKFLKYGTGFFGGSYRELLDRHILSAVADGVDILFRNHLKTDSVIKYIEFPFFKSGDESSIQKLEALKQEFGVQYSFSREDALRVENCAKGTILATTNCADPHAVTGNEMGFGSVDGAIAENLKSKGNIFCPWLNKKMKEEFVDL